MHICAAAVPSTVATEIPTARTVWFLILRGFHPASRRALSKSSAKSELSASNKLEAIAAPTPTGAEALLDYSESLLIAG